MTPAKPYCYAYPHPAVTTDVVLFTWRDGQLQLLLIQRARPPFAGCWALPGGFVDIDEDLAAGAARELREETGLDAPALQQLQAFGAVGRDPRERVISIAYLGTIAATRQGATRAGDDAAAAQWFALADLPALAFDHGAIITAARQRLSERLEAADPQLLTPLLPASFTLTELQRVCEALLGREIGHGDEHLWTRLLSRVEGSGPPERDGGRRRQRYRWRSEQGDGRAPDRASH